MPVPHQEMRGVKPRGSIMQHGVAPEVLLSSDNARGIYPEQCALPNTEVSPPKEARPLTPMTPGATAPIKSIPIGKRPEGSHDTASLRGAKLCASLRSVGG